MFKNKREGELFERGIARGKEKEREGEGGDYRSLTRSTLRHIGNIVHIQILYNQIQCRDNRVDRYRVLTRGNS